MKVNFCVCGNAFFVIIGICFANLSGYRMAAECARNALLEKVVDNKLDAGL